MTLLEKEAYAMSVKMVGKAKELILKETNSSLDEIYFKLNSSINKDRETLDSHFSKMKSTTEKKVEDL